MKEKRKRWLVLIIAAVIIGALVGCGTNEVVATTEAKQVSETKEVTTEAVTESTNTYKDGMYKVGSDIEPGLYKVEISEMIGMGYIERAKDSSMTIDSIIANVALTGDGYVQVKDSDAFVKVTGAVLTAFDIDSASKSLLDLYEDGMYIVGIDIEPGEYKVEVTDTVSKIGYVERVSDASFEMDSIIANSVIQNQAYVTISDTDFAVRLQGVKLSK